LKETSMNIDKRWMLLLAVTASAAAGAAFASRTLRHQARATGQTQHSTNLKTWENEGGNLAPPPASALQPAAH
jgi:hypothetical protein